MTDNLSVINKVLFGLVNNGNIVLLAKREFEREKKREEQRERVVRIEDIL